MSIFTTILASIVAIEHLYIMYLETFATHSNSTSRVFNMAKDELQRKSCHLFTSPSPRDLSTSRMTPSALKKKPNDEQFNIKMTSILDSAA